MPKLPRSFYDRTTILVARELLGKFLVHVLDGVERIGRIVEVEAYESGGPANVPPTVSLTSPTEGASFAVSTPVG
jgi:3-methyladenine DNA glycosylase Mpg